MKMKPGDKVVYPMYGAGKIVSAEYKEVMGTTKLYFLLKLPYDRLTLFIPEDHPESLGIRAPVSKKEIPDVIKALGRQYAFESDNWHKKQRECSDLLKKGDIYSVVKAYSLMSKLESTRGTALGDKKLKNVAKNVLFSEIATAMDINFLEVEALIKEELEKLNAEK